MINVAIIGAAGNMGQATMEQLRDVDCINKIKLLCHKRAHTRKLLKQIKSLREKTELIYGSLADENVCSSLISGCDIVINMGAVIPPLSDQRPLAAVECNERGANALVSAIEKAENRPALIHISTVALYGNRTDPHRYGRVGDPLLVSPFDIYSATKLRGEFRVLESSIESWAVLRQTAMLHKNMLGDNIHDGLMFHTCFNAPLEWLTAHDSGLLIKNLLIKFAADEIPRSFWKRCYNMAGGAVNRSFGIDTLNDGFALIGGSATDYFTPYTNATRNFHGVWYADGNELNDIFDYQTQSVSDYWREIGRLHPSFKLAKSLPKGLIRYFAVGRLLNDPNSPTHWVSKNDEAHIFAYFGGKARYDALKSANDWNAVMPSESDCAQKEWGDNRSPIEYGYDITKPDDKITLDDMKSVAAAHGGKLVSSAFDGDMYKKLEWETQDGERFTATPYTVLRAGHWFNPTYTKNVWDFDRLSKKDKIYASVWYDSHATDEDVVYSYDDNFAAVMEKLSWKK